MLKKLDWSSFFSNLLLVCSLVLVGTLIFFASKAGTVKAQSAPYDPCNFTDPSDSSGVPYTVNSNPVTNTDIGPAGSSNAGQKRYFTSDSDGTWWYTPVELPTGCFLVNEDAHATIGPCYPQIKVNSYNVMADSMDKVRGTKTPKNFTETFRVLNPGEVVLPDSRIGIPSVGQVGIVIGNIYTNYWWGK